MAASPGLAGQGALPWAMRAWLALVIVLAMATATARVARAQDAARMTADMERYFEGERRAGYVALGVGLAAAGGGVWLITRDDPRARGASWPILAVAAGEIGAGIVLLVRTGGQIDDRRAQIATDPGKFRSSERTRMARVARTFTGLKYAEISLMLGGIATAYLGQRGGHLRLQGAGLGLAAQALAVLMFDLEASSRADEYRVALDRFEPGAPGAAVTPLQGGVMLAFGGAF